MTSGTTTHVFNVYKDGKAGLTREKGIKGANTYEVLAISKECETSFSNLKEKQVEGHFFGTGVVITKVLTDEQATEKAI